MDRIYDWETFGQSTDTLPVISLAVLDFDQSRFKEKPYSYEELVNASKFFKFDVSDQVVKYGRRIESDTLRWWSEQSPEAQKAVAPSSDDLPISELPTAFIDNDPKGLIFTRGNTFDAIITENFFKLIDKPMPYNWWQIRDTRSYIEGMFYGTDMKNSFIPVGLSDKFVAHDPRHDVAMDVMRIQTLAQTLAA